MNACIFVVPKKLQVKSVYHVQVSDQILLLTQAGLFHCLITLPVKYILILNRAFSFSFLSSRLYLSTLELFSLNAKRYLCSSPTIAGFRLKVHIQSCHLIGVAHIEFIETNTRTIRSIVSTRT